MKKRKGFTLIELLVAILIVALVATIAFLIIPNLLDNVEEEKNKINLNTIKSSASLYVGEYSDEIMWMTEYSGKDTNVIETGNEYACTTVKMLQNKGYINEKFSFSDPDTNVDVNENTSVKVLRDKEKLVIKDEIFLNSVDCTEYDTTVLEAVFSATGEMGNNNWYINNLNVNVKPIGKDGTSIGKSGVKGIWYVIKDNGKNIIDPIIEINKNGKFGEYGLNIPINNNSNNLTVCVSIVNGLDVYTEQFCSPVYKLDNTTPSYSIKTSDGIESNNWHKTDFELSIDVSSFVSPLTYYIDTDVNLSEERKEIVINNETNSSNYYFKVCNEAGTCSNVQNYVVKLDKTKPTVSLEKSTEDYVKKLTLTGTSNDDGSEIVKYKITKDSSYSDSGWTSVSSISKITTEKEITENDKYYLWAQDEAGNFNSIVNNVTNIDNEGPTYVSGGTVNEGSVSEAIFDDVSKPITVYYIVKNKKEEPSASEFTSTSRTFTSECANTYYAYVKAVDSLGNYTIKYLGYKTTGACCDEGTYGEKYCNNKGWYEQSRYNECLNKTEYNKLTEACEYSDCDDWGDCQSNGYKYRDCVYYYGGEKDEDTKKRKCTYVAPDDDDDDSSGGVLTDPIPECTDEPECPNGMSGKCSPSSGLTSNSCPEYTCECCHVSGTDIITSGSNAGFCG